MNVERVWRHRRIILAALKAYEKGLNKLAKDAENLEVEEEDADYRLAVIEELRSEFDPSHAGGPALEGTPMGEAVTAQVMQDDDGTSLTVDVLDELLRGVGIDAPVDHIGAWTLEQRKVVHAFVKARQVAILDDGVQPVRPEIIAEEWVTDKDALLERELAADEVDAALGGGPWGVRAAPGASPAEEEWQVFMRAGSQIVEDGKLVETIGDTTHAQTYGQIDRARLIAANLNLIERGMRVGAGLEPIAEAAPAEESEQAPEPATEPAAVS